MKLIAIVRAVLLCLLSLSVYAFPAHVSRPATAPELSSITSDYKSCMAVTNKFSRVVGAYAASIITSVEDIKNKDLKHMEDAYSLYARMFGLMSLEAGNANSCHDGQCTITMAFNCYNLFYNSLPSSAAQTKQLMTDTLGYYLDVYNKGKVPSVVNTDKNRAPVGSIVCTYNSSTPDSTMKCKVV